MGSSSPSDIVFLVDTSEGVNQNDVRQQKEFIKLVAQRLGVSPGTSHAAVLSYSDRTRLIGGFYAYLRGEGFDEVVDSVTVTQTGGKRDLEEALKQAKRKLSLARPKVPRIVFLITYGKQAQDFDSPRLGEAAKGLLDMGASLYVIAVGVNGSDPQLQSLVKRPTDFFHVQTSEDLLSYVTTLTYYVGSGGCIKPNTYTTNQLGYTTPLILPSAVIKS